MSSEEFDQSDAKSTISEVENEVAVERFNAEACRIMKSLMDKCLKKAEQIGENHGWHNRLLNHYGFCLHSLANTIAYVHKWSHYILNRQTFLTFCVKNLQNLQALARNAERDFEKMPEIGAFDEDDEPRITHIPLFASSRVCRVLSNRGFLFNEIENEISESNSTLTVSENDSKVSSSDEMLSTPERLYRTLIEHGSPKQLMFLLRTPPSSPLPQKLIYSPNVNNLDTSSQQFVIGSPPPPMATIDATHVTKAMSSLSKLAEPEKENSPNDEESTPKADVIFVERKSIPPKLNFAVFTDDELADDKSEC